MRRKGSTVTSVGGQFNHSLERHFILVIRSVTLIFAQPVPSAHRGIHLQSQLILSEWRAAGVISKDIKSLSAL